MKISWLTVPTWIIFGSLGCVAQSADVNMKSSEIIVPEQVNTGSDPGPNVWPTAT